MNKLYPENVKAILRAAICSVKFTKVNGEERTLRCTLRQEYLPERKEANKEAAKTDAADPNVINVYEVDLQAWRSFRLERMESITILP